MPLSTLLTKVEEITKRPDARARALLAANDIISDICNNADYPEDLIEVQLVNPDPSKTIATIPITMVDTPAVRKVEYLTINDRMLKNIKPRNAITADGCIPPDVYYRAGSNLQVYSATMFDTAKFGYYQQTPYLSESDTHWTLDVIESILILGVTAAVFIATGDDASGQIYEGKYRTARQQFRRMRADSEDL